MNPPIPATAPAIERSQREEIARIVDPQLWALRERHLEYAEQADYDDHRQQWIDRADDDVAPSLTKADAILTALQQTRAEIVEECARVAEVEAADFAALQRGRKDLYRMGQKDGCAFAAAAIRALATETDANDGARG